MPPIVEVQIDLGELRAVLGCQLAARALRLHAVRPQHGCFPRRFDVLDPSAGFVAEDVMILPEVERLRLRSLRRARLPAREDLSDRRRDRNLPWLLRLRFPARKV